MTVAVTRYTQQEVRRFIQTSVLINQSPCYASARVDLKELAIKGIQVASLPEIDRHTTFSWYLAANDAYEVVYGREHVSCGEGIKCTVNGFPALFLPPVIEVWGAYQIVVGGFCALFTAIDAGHTSISAMVVRSISRELPPFEMIPENLPKSSLEQASMKMTWRENGEHRHFISAY